MAAGGDAVDCFDLTLPTQKLFHPRNRIRRLAHRLLGDFLKLFSRHWVQVVLPLFEIGEKFLILHGRVESVAQDLDSIRALPLPVVQHEPVRLEQGADLRSALVEHLIQHRHEYAERVVAELEQVAPRGGHMSSTRNGAKVFT